MVYYHHSTLVLCLSMDQRKTDYDSYMTGKYDDEYRLAPRGSAEPELVYAVARDGISSTNYANI